MKTLHFWLTLVLFAGLFTFTACDKDDTDDMDEMTTENSDPFLGAWLVVEAEGLFAEDNQGLIYTFEESGDMNIEGESFTSFGTYVRNDTLLTYDIGGIEVQFEYVMEEEKMDWESTTSDQKFKLEKQK